ncbi:hypothetical protein N431DRAFT_449487 [Stipitochalara longipes BDJ]|nr:hypothetical protein N431DRAFT_449487 [Stipitochalara longipes BDJ]
MYTIGAPGQGWESRESDLAVNASRSPGLRLRPLGLVLRAGPKTTKALRNPWGSLRANDVATARRCDRLILQQAPSTKQTPSRYLRSAPWNRDSIANAKCLQQAQHRMSSLLSGRFDQLDKHERRKVPRQAVLEFEIIIGFGAVTNGEIKSCG